MTSLTGEKRLFAPNKTIWWLGVLLSCGVGLLCYMGTSKWIEHDTSVRFKTQARTAQHNLNAQIKSYGDLLRGTVGVFQLKESISKAQFHQYVAGLALPAHYPAITTINFARYVRDQDRAAFEETMRQQNAQELYPPFHLQPDGRRDSYTVLTLLEPDDIAAARFGIDISVQPLRAAHLQQSMETGEMTSVCKPVPTATSAYITEIAMRLPVYRAGMPVDTVARRRSAYLGSAGLGFDIDKLANSVLSEMAVNKVRLVLYREHGFGDELPTPNLRRPLFDSAMAAGDTSAAPTPKNWFETTLLIDYNQNYWWASFSAPKAEVYTRFDRYFPWLAMMAGFIGCISLLALFQALSSSRMQAIGMAKDMTRELRDSQARLQISHQKLRRLAAHADQIKEEERKRIAREIHDDLGQNLLVLRIEADMLASRTALRHPRLHARARSTLSQIDTTIKSVRHIINDLRPTVLDLGLNAAVEWQIAEFRRRTGIVCELNDYQTEIRVSDQYATAFFRILQESLSNITQHAKASLVQVELRKDKETLSMTVRDNGIGIKSEGFNKAGSFGLVGIEERIKLLGGHSSIVSNQGAGMTVHVSVPIPYDALSLPYVPKACDLEQHGTVS
jgi:signal transduction histidine kinase